ncbi:MAG TPA: GatB/YqeY domain-containing protein [Terriglobales bacterium]|nr:GatB/YqeY domain-containing protein [Terriglobales bacterium]
MNLNTPATGCGFSVKAVPKGSGRSLAGATRAPKVGITHRAVAGLRRRRLYRWPDAIILSMPLVEQIQQDITAAMKARDEARLSTLRMVKAALMNRKIEKMAELDEKEAQQVLSTLIKQRKESIEQFTKGGRQEMADKEAAEIALIETYLPKAAGQAEIEAGVKAVIAEMGSPSMKDMGTVMKNAMAKFAAQGMRVDGKLVSEAVKKELAGN